MAVIIISIVKGVWEGRRGGEWEGIQRANKTFPGVTIYQELRKGRFFPRDLTVRIKKTI